jgi:hypothetical protein
LFVVGAFSVVGYSLEYANQAYDFTEDLEAGLATPVVRLGLVRSIRLAVFTFFVALPLLTFAMAHLALSRGAVAFIVGPSGGVLVALGAAAAVAAGYAVAIRGMVRIYRASQEEGLGSQQLVERVRSHCNYALWQSSGVGGLFAYALVVFLLTSTAVSQVHAAAPGAFSFEGPVTIEGGPISSVPEITITGSIAAAELEGRPFSRGELRLEYATSISHGIAQLGPVDLPAAGGSVSFRLRAIEPSAIGAVSYRIYLVVDTNFDGQVDFAAASAYPVRI